MSAAELRSLLALEDQLIATDPRLDDTLRTGSHSRISPSPAVFAALLLVGSVLIGVAAAIGGTSVALVAASLLVVLACLVAARYNRDPGPGADRAQS